MELGAEVATIQRSGGPGLSIRADLSQAEDAAKATAEAIGRLGRLDICVCNAGTIDRTPALEVPLDVFRQVFETNVVSAFAVSRAAAQAFISQGSGGTIIHLASVLAVLGGIQVSAYAASKGAIAQLARAQSNEWAPEGIRVNALAAGYVDTDMTLTLRQDAKRRDEITARIPLGRWADPKEVADVAAWLCMPESRYITGAVIAVDGGFLAR
jgi:2-deoxy-D-gluconate 3-dehydrogenase